MAKRSPRHSCAPMSIVRSRRPSGLLRVIGTISDAGLPWAALPSRLRKRVSEQRVAAGHEEILFAVKFDRRRSAAHPADVLMPDDLAVAGTNRQKVAAGV